MTQERATALRRVRESAGFVVEDVARVARVSARAIADYESGVVEPSPAMEKRWEAALQRLTERKATAMRKKWGRGL